MIRALIPGALPNTGVECTTLTCIFWATSTSTLSSCLQCRSLRHLGISILRFEHRWFRDLAQEVLHLERLEYFALALEDQYLDSSLIKFSPTFSWIFILTETIKDVLCLQNASLFVNLLDEALLVELNSHGLESSRQHQFLMLSFDKETDCSHTVSLFCFLEPVMHDCGKVDVIGKAAFTLVQLSFFLLSSAKVKPLIHSLIFKKMIS